MVKMFPLESTEEMLKQPLESVDTELLLFDMGKKFS